MFCTRRHRDDIIVLYAWKEVIKMVKNKSYDEEFKKMIVELYESHTTTAEGEVTNNNIKKSSPNQKIAMDNGREQRPLKKRVA